MDSGSVSSPFYFLIPTNFVRNRLNQAAESGPYNGIYLIGRKSGRRVTAPSLAMCKAVLVLQAAQLEWVWEPQSS